MVTFAETTNSYLCIPGTKLIFPACDIGCALFLLFFIYFFLALMSLD
jgi:hypothetical protein